MSAAQHSAHLTLGILHTHPKHFSRFSLFPVGRRFVRPRQCLLGKSANANRWAVQAQIHLQLSRKQGTKEFQCSSLYCFLDEYSSSSSYSHAIWNEYKVKKKSRAACIPYRKHPAHIPNYYDGSLTTYLFCDELAKLC